MNDITLAVQVMAKIFSGMFLTTEGMFVVALFALSSFAFYLKARLEA